MTATGDMPLMTAALRQSAVRATRAPSVYNTQPWRFVLDAGRLTIRADGARQLRLRDPRRRLLLASCGCALFTARVALAARGWDAVVRRLPDPADPELVATLTPVGVADDVPAEWAALDQAIELQAATQLVPGGGAVPSPVLDRLVGLAALEGAAVIPVECPAARALVARLTAHAQSVEDADPAFRTEYQAWAADDTSQGFDPDADETVMLLGVHDDEPLAWLRAGEALQRMLLELTLAGYAARLSARATETPALRAELAAGLGVDVHPLGLMRLGRGAPSRPRRGRRLVDVLHVLQTGVPTDGRGAERQNSLEHLPSTG